MVGNHNNFNCNVFSRFCDCCPCPDCFHLCLVPLWIWFSPHTFFLPRLTFSHLCTSLLLCLLPKTGLLLDFGLFDLPAGLFCLQGSFSLISTFADDALWFCLMQNPYAISRGSFFFFAVTVQQASSLASSPNLSKHHLPYKQAPHVHIMRAFTGLTSPVWCNKSRRVSTTRQSHLGCFWRKLRCNVGQTVFFFFKKHSLYVPSPENKYTHSNQRVGQQSSNGHHVHQRFQVKQESHDSYHKGKWF